MMFKIFYTCKSQNKTCDLFRVLHKQLGMRNAPLGKSFYFLALLTLIPAGEIHSYVQPKRLTIKTSLKKPFTRQYNIDTMLLIA